MVLYNFKTIVVVPTHKDFIDIILSKTQRKTPTVVHKGWKISRIRSFYMRKVKFTQQNFHDKLGQILEDFPKLDDIHPFYADLINVLYSRDHYKLALGQLNTARQLIDHLCKDYLKMLKFGDSLYRCKELKRAAMGRMCTLMKKMGPSLSYLEEVRQHLARLPSIDPNTTTLIITGYPNVGKSSFINKISRADVEVQPYAFTTKSLFVGHCDYKYVRWQVIDTPGILDHPLEDRNTIEMQAVTALAHLHSTILFFIDISEACGYTIKQQVALYHSIKPLFTNKPLLVVCNKIDLKKMEQLDDEDKALIESVRSDRDTKLCTMSNVSEEGVTAVKNAACDMLLEYRVARKLRSKRIDDVINRIHVAKPVKRDNKQRSTTIPSSVLEMKAKKKAGVPIEKRRTEKDLEAAGGGAGIYDCDVRKWFDLKDKEWQNDIIPEIIDGKNIADFIDPEIEQRLAALEREEEELASRYADNVDMGDESDELDEEQKVQVGQIRDKRKLIIAKRIRDRTSKSVLPRTAKRVEMKDVESNLAEVGLDASKVRERSKSRGRKRRAADDADMEDEDMEDGDGPRRGRSRTARTDSKARSKSRAHSQSRPRDSSAFKSPQAKAEAEKVGRKIQNKKFKKNPKKGEGDRTILNEMPRHLFSGKRGIGTNDRR